jgi:hypothetical protein
MEWTDVGGGRGFGERFGDRGMSALLVSPQVGSGRDLYVCALSARAGGGGPKDREKKRDKLRRGTGCRFLVFGLMRGGSRLACSVTGNESTRSIVVRGGMCFGNSYPTKGRRWE